MDLAEAMLELVKGNPNGYGHMGSGEANVCTVKVRKDGTTLITDYSAALKIHKDLCPGPICNSPGGVATYYRLSRDAYLTGKTKEGLEKVAASTGAGQNIDMVENVISAPRKKIQGQTEISNLCYWLRTGETYSTDFDENPAPITDAGAMLWALPDKVAVVMKTSKLLYVVAKKHLDLLLTYSEEARPGRTLSWRMETLEFAETKSAFGPGYLLHAEKTLHHSDGGESTRKRKVEIFVSSLSDITTRTILAGITHTGMELAHMHKSGIGNPHLLGTPKGTIKVVTAKE